MSQALKDGQPRGTGAKDTIPSDNGDKSGRDGRGRFASGNRFGLGTSFARRAGRLRQAIQDEVTEDDLRRVVRALVEKAAQGDVAAARVLLAYAVGKPQPAPEPDRATVDEAQTLADQAQAGLRLARVAPEVAHEALVATIPNYGQAPPEEADDPEEDGPASEAPPDVVEALTLALGRLPAEDRRQLARWARGVAPPDAAVTAAAPSKPPR